MLTVKARIRLIQNYQQKLVMRRLTNFLTTWWQRQEYANTRIVHADFDHTYSLFEVSVQHRKKLTTVQR